MTKRQVLEGTSKWSAKVAIKGLSPASMEAFAVVCKNKMLFSVVININEAIRGANRENTFNLS